MYSFPYVAGDANFYRLAYERDGYPDWKWEFQMTLDRLREVKGHGLKVLEVGAGNGAFLKRLMPEITRSSDIEATEFSDYGIAEIGKLGVKCFSCDVRQLSGKDHEEKYDAICMFQVLEHLGDLDALFTHLHKLLNKNGSVYIAVPNADRIRFNEQNGALLDMPPNHIGRWNEQSFQKISSRFGFSLQEYALEPFSLASAVKQLGAYRFLRKSQRKGSLENRIAQIKSRPLKSLLAKIFSALNLVSTLPSLLKLDSTLGSSQWVHLKKL